MRAPNAIRRLARHIARQNAWYTSATPAFDLTAAVREQNLLAIPPALWDELESNLARDPSLALGMAQVLAAVAEQGQDPLILARALLARVSACNERWEFSQTLRFCPAAARAQAAVGDSGALARVWLEAAWAESYLGHLNAAEEYLTRAAHAVGTRQVPSLLARADWIRARMLRERGETKAALDLFTRVRDSYREQGDRQMATRVLREIGHTHIHLSPADALKPMRHARAYFVRAGIPVQTALCDFFCAQALLDLNRFEPARARLLRAQDVFSRFFIPFLFAACELDFAFLAWFSEQYPEMLAHSESARRTLVELKVIQEVASAEINIGIALGELNRYSEAASYLEQALANALKSERKPKAAVALLNLSDIRIKQGQYARALEHLQHARTLLTAIHSVARLVACDLRLGRLYLYLAAYPQAAQAIERAARAAGKESIATRRAQCELYRAQLHILRGQSRRASAALRRARAHFARNQQLVHVAYCNRLLAEIPTRRQAAALARLDNARAVFYARHQIFDVALCDLIRGEIQLRGQEPSAAVQSFMEAQRVLRHFPAYAARVSYGLARGERDRDTLAASRHYRESAQSIAQVRREVGLESLSNSFFQARQHVVADGLELARKHGSAGDALHLIEAAKAQLFVQTLAPSEWRTESSSARLRELRAREQALRTELEKRRKRLVWQVEPDQPALRGVGWQRGSKAELAELADLARAYEEVVAELRLAHRGLRGLPALAPFEPEEFRAAAHARWGTKWTALDYYFTPGRLHIVQIDSQQVTLTVQPWTRHDRFWLEQAAATHRDLRELIYHGTLRGDRIPARPDPLRMLADKLIPGELTAYEDMHLIVVPHGLVHQLPMHALPIGTQRLLERFTVSYIPNLQAFTNLAAVPERVGQKMLVCGLTDFGGHAPNLHYTPAEVNALAKLHPNAQVLWQGQATRATLLEWNRTGTLAQFETLHFSTHARVENDSPYSSRILLADTDLTVLDIQDLELNANLVTLSACSSNLGTGGSGDEWVSLARAFYYAGTRALVASLWEVEDASTAELITRMYRNLGKGDSVAAALREAQVEALRAGVKPYHWAAFTASGAV